MSTTEIIFPKRKYELPIEHKTPIETGLICPVCSRGGLYIYVDNVFAVEPTDIARKYMDQEYCNGEFWFTEFHGFLICNNGDCKKQIVFAGKYGCDDDKCEVETGAPIQYTAIKIGYIECPPRIIGPYYSDIPTDIEITLAESFMLYWVDNKGCGEKIKVCLEQIMDKLRIGGGDVWTTHLKKRIEHLSNNYEDLREKLSSSEINWLKDTPNHNMEITEDNLRAGYRLLDFILKKRVKELNA